MLKEWKNQRWRNGKITGGRKGQKWLTMTNDGGNYPLKTIHFLTGNYKSSIK